MKVIVEEWEARHPHFPALMEFIQGHGQAEWVTFMADWHRSSHLLVSTHNNAPVGFLRFVVQPIGPDAGCPPVQFEGSELLEAKVLAFAVDAPYRSRGIGRQLQEDMIRRAKMLGCFQIRSHSGGDHPANHALKLSLGFGIHPIVRGADRRGAYFILPLTGGKQPGHSDRPGGDT